MISDKRKEELLKPWLIDGELLTAQQIMDRMKALPANPQQKKKTSKKKTSVATPDEDIRDEDAEYWNAYAQTQEEADFLQQELKDRAFKQLPPAIKAVADAKVHVEQVLLNIEHFAPDLLDEATRMASDCVSQPEDEDAFRILVGLSGIEDDLTPGDKLIKLFAKQKKLLIKGTSRIKVFRMLARMEMIQAQEDPKKCPWLGPEKADELRRKATRGQCDLNSQDIETHAKTLQHRHNRELRKKGLRRNHNKLTD